MLKYRRSNKPDPLDYTALFDALGLAYFVVRVDEPHYTIVAASEAFASMKGTVVAGMLNRPFFKLFPDMDGVESSFRQVIDTKEKLQIDSFRHDIRNKDGTMLETYWQRTYYPILGKDDKVAFILSASEDITDELSITYQLGELEDRLEDILEIGKVGGWLWDPDEKVIKVDKTLAQLYGLSAARGAAGVPVSALLNTIHPEDRASVAVQIEHALAKGTDFEAEYRTISPDGAVHWVLARGRRKVVTGSKMATFPGVIIDITERHEFKTELENARVREALNRKEAELLQKRNEELEILSRSKDEFVALASHQLRTPATAVKQYIGMVLQGYVGKITETQTDMLEKAFQSNERQIQIINQILSAARVDTGSLVMVLAPVDLRALMQGIVDEMRPSLEQKGHSVEAKLRGEPVEVMADVNYIRMAIENVIHNAGVYTSAPGHISVSIRKTTKGVRVIVADSGVGIKKSDINKLFVKFSRIHNPLSVQAGGSGIGLYLTAEILRLHEGNVLVESQLGKGTTFTLTLPIRRE